ncbi:MULTISPECIES: type III glutamate--ammonia ligase [unclassified Pseudoclavibacter]|uniref:type III glutamate--ammonia ligase n=1 Tax=unclassified Pseudoclavibacter TaxID=2615177 RepID=UPI0012F06CEB|nr:MULTISPECIES: type III glutamate--ammonia ligase [unclassified Pseudoclavibacter]VXB68418.1 Type III glutamate--ammonia ligase [Pseudoclavibacter sp. 8L]
MSGNINIMRETTMTQLAPKLVEGELAADDRITLRDLAQAHGVQFILATFVDLNGKPCAKLVPTSAADELEAGALGFAGFAAGLIGQEQHDPDLIAIPDLDSFTPLPFVREGLALVHCDPHVNGKPWPYAPRNILKRAIAELATRGMTAKVGAEVEYFLVDRAEDGTLAPADKRDNGPRPCYDARGVTRMYDHLSSVSTAINSLGWGNYANDHEDGAGQFEQNFDYADALTTADRVITLRYILNVLAEERGMTATFMPKPFTNRTGTGLHLHLSLWSEQDEPLFPANPGAGGTAASTDDAASEPAADARGLGLSPVAYGFVAGLLEHAPALQAFLAPSVNSYKRIGTATSSSGATWSPRKASYGGNDRTHMVRVPDNKRVELRSGDGAANPYLAVATSIMAGLDGIDNSIDPGNPSGPGQAPEGAAVLPATLLHAVEALRRDPVILASLSGDEATGRYFADAKETEFLTWHAQVSDWELDTYLTAF